MSNTTKLEVKVMNITPTKKEARITGGQKTRTGEHVVEMLNNLPGVTKLNSVKITDRHGAVMEFKAVVIDYIANEVQIILA